jgi:hypothetical protein
MTVTIELYNQSALQLLKQLEEMNILKLIVPVKKTVERPKKRRWAGSISRETGDKMLNYLEKSRNEWERNI